MNEQISEYEKFRLQRLINKTDDDNFSAHFSATKSMSNNLSDRDNQMSLFFQAQSPNKNMNTVDIEIKYNNLLIAHEKLKESYKQKESEACKYKQLYLNRLQKQRQTKGKLKLWINEVKKNLPESP